MAAEENRPMACSIELTLERKGFTKVIRGSTSARPEFSEFKDLPALETVRLGGRELFEPNISVQVSAEKGVFSTTYKLIANFHGTMPLSNKYGGRLTGWAEVSQHSVHYFDAEGVSAGVTNRNRLQMEKQKGIDMGMSDDYCLGLEGNLNAVIELVSKVPLFKAAALRVIKAVAAEAGDIKTVKTEANKE